MEIEIYVDTEASFVGQCNECSVDCTNWISVSWFYGVTGGIVYENQFCSDCLERKIKDFEKPKILKFRDNVTFQG